jgi:hypothetical protein
MINSKFRITTNSVFGNVLIILLFAGVFFLKFFVTEVSLINRLRPVDLVLFATILILGLGINKTKWLEFYAKYRLIIFSISMILVLAFFDLVFRAQWKEIAIDVYSLFYLLIPLYLFIILKVRINLAAILYIDIIFILITMILVIESITSLQTTSRMVLLGTFSDPNHTSSWLVGATLLALALKKDSSYKNQLFFITIVLIFCGMTDSNASNLSILVMVVYSFFTFPRLRSLPFSKKVGHLLVMIFIVILTLSVIPKVVSNVVTTKKLNSQILNIFFSEGSPKASTEASPKASTEASPKASTEGSPKASTEASPKASTEASPKASTEASPKASTEASPKAILSIDLIQNFNFHILKPTRVDQVTESRKILFSQAIVKFKDNPLGVGFDETLVKVPSSGAMMGVHNIFLTFLVAHGVVGLITLIFLFYSLYKYGGFYSRAYLLSIVTVGLFQESFSWRHQWLFLALFFIIDENIKNASKNFSTINK